MKTKSGSELVSGNSVSTAPGEIWEPPVCSRFCSLSTRFTAKHRRLAVLKITLQSGLLFYNFHLFSRNKSSHPQLQNIYSRRKVLRLPCNNMFAWCHHFVQKPCNQFAVRIPSPPPLRQYADGISALPSAR